MTVRIRRGLPRAEGEQPWPTDELIASFATAATGGHAPVNDEAEAADAAESRTAVEPVDEARTVGEARASGDVRPSGEATSEGATTEVGLRVGLPRATGQEGWPTEAAARVPSDQAVRLGAVVAAASNRSESVEADDSSSGKSSDERAVVDAPTAAEKVADDAFDDAVTSEERLLTESIVIKRAPRRLWRFTVMQWLGGGLFVVLGAMIVVAAVVMLARRLVAVDEVAAFLERYPGQAPLPEASAPGMPAWVNVQHFFNLFLMALIVQSGLRVRHQRTPDAYWQSTRGRSKKVSIMQWLHQSLTVFWVTNGVIFLVLMLVTGHWMRLVPTSTDVFGNAASAALQYAALDWPVESGWVNYNALQQLAYFATVFVAAPLAVVTGVRLSTVWPTRPRWLGIVFPAGLARAVHFPTMVYFVAFVVVHVALVLSTGWIRNLNVMFAARDDGQSLVGFALFVGAVVITVAAAVLARPSIFAPLARPFGTVTRR